MLKWLVEPQIAKNQLDTYQVRNVISVGKYKKNNISTEYKVIMLFCNEEVHDLEVTCFRKTVANWEFEQA